MADARVVVVGDVIDDVVVVPSGPIRTDTDTTSTIALRAGGSAANSAAWLGELGASVDFVGIVGEADVARHAALLERFGVRAHLSAHPVLPTGTIVVLVQGEQRAMLTERGANAAFDPDAVPDSLLEGAAALLLTGHSVSGDTSPASMVSLHARARALGVPVVVSPGSAGHIADFGVDKFREVFAAAAVIISSLDEARVLSGLDGADAAATALLAVADLVVLTNGGDGIVIASSAGLTHVAIERATVIDPTGAGDAFTAGFLREWTRSGDAVAAARLGCATAARSIALVGGRPL
ncbi:PfkB family carbohydrate kinase [soil metagenome]